MTKRCLTVARLRTVRRGVYERALRLAGCDAGQDTSATVRFYDRPLFWVTPDAGLDANSRAAQIERRSNRLVETQSPLEDILVAVQFWADSRRSDYAATTSAVRASVVEALKRAGLGLPEPAVRIIVLRAGVANPQLTHDSPPERDGPR